MNATRSGARQYNAGFGLRTRTALITAVAAAHLAALAAMTIDLAPPPALESLIQIEAVLETAEPASDPIPQEMATTDGADETARADPTVAAPPEVAQGEPQAAELPPQIASSHALSEPADPPVPEPAAAKAPPNEAVRDALADKPPPAAAPRIIPPPPRPVVRKAATKRQAVVDDDDDDDDDDATPQPRQPRRAQVKAKTIRRLPANGRVARQGVAGSQATGYARGAARADASAGVSRAAYAAQVMGQIQARKFYPLAARAAGTTGVVGFAFAIGRSGAPSRFSVTRSSGSGALDQAARQIVMSLRLPPPPGGSFSASSSLNFRLSR